MPLDQEFQSNLIPKENLPHSDLQLNDSVKTGEFLLVDDTNVNLKLVSDFLRESGFKVRGAKSGWQALKILEITSPDLILLDVIMPEMDGFETCSRLKAWDKTKDIPVIFMTAIADASNPEHKVQGLALGAVDYISKPIQLAEVLARVRTHLHLHFLTKQLQEQNAHLCAEIEVRRKTEEQLRLLERAIAASSNGILISDPHQPGNPVIYANSGFERITGYKREDILGKNCRFLQGTDTKQPALDKLHRAIAEGQETQVVLRNYRKDGTLFWNEFCLNPVRDEAGHLTHFIGVQTDITEHKKREEELQQAKVREREKAQQLQLTLNELKHAQTQLIQSEKMSSLGRMVAGIAHEINNPVSFIYGNLNPAREYFKDLINLLELYQKTYVKPPPEIKQLAEKIDLDFVVEDWSKLMHSIQNGAERIEQIVVSLRSFSRLDESELKQIDIHEGIEQTLLILQHRFRAVGNSPGIEVIKNYGQLPLITCYASQLNQVFMNLLNNAIDALESQPQPRVITISTALSQHSKLKVQNEQGQTPNPQILNPNPQYAVVRITDNGIGMCEEVCQQIFDPFFTTKSVGSGTGLGLAISHQIIVEKHKGQIRCISAPGQGTELIVQIPINLTDLS